MRLAVAGFTGLAVWLTVAALSNAALYAPFDLRWPPHLDGFWGLLYGSFAGVVSFGIALWLSSRRFSRAWKVGRLIAATALGVFGLGVASWILMWGVSPFSLEGAWIFPLAVIPLIGAVALFRSFRRSSKGTASDATEAQARWSRDLYR
jgi:hypothetical protein